MEREEREEGREHLLLRDVTSRSTFALCMGVYGSGSGREEKGGGRNDRIREIRQCHLVSG